MSRVLKSIFVFLDIALIAACVSVTPPPVNTVVATKAPSLTTISPTIISTPTATTVAGPTPAGSTPTQPVSTSTPGLPTSNAPEGLRMAYIFDGNLYLQDGSRPPVQLTSSGEDWQPNFTEDGEKIVFFRGRIPHDLYVINADGSQELALVNNSRLTALGLGYDEMTELRFFYFVPGTHRLLFNTTQLASRDVERKDFNRPGAKWNRDLLIVDADTGEIKRLLPPGQGGGVVVSPDGSQLAVHGSGHVDIIGIDGQVIRRNLVTYTPSQPIELVPGIYWTPDASELIVLLPVETWYDMEGPETYSVWRYPLDGGPAVQVPLDPPPMSGDEVVSPDGNWIVYSYFPEGIFSSHIPLYVADLREDHTQLCAPDVTRLPIDGWSPDSKQFIYEWAPQLFLVAFGESPEFFDEGTFIGWIDASRYLYMSRASKMIMLAEIGRKSLPIFGPYSEPCCFDSPRLFDFIYLKGERGGG